MLLRMHLEICTFVIEPTVVWIQVYVELTSYGTRMHGFVEDQQRHLQQVQDKVKLAQRGTGTFVGRIGKALDKTWQLEQRIKACSNLPGLRQKPLTAEELSFKSELGQCNDIFLPEFDSLGLGAFITYK